MGLLFMLSGTIVMFLVDVLPYPYNARYPVPQLPLGYVAGAVGLSLILARADVLGRRVAGVFTGGLKYSGKDSVVMAPGTLRLEENARLRYMEWLLGRLEDAGFSPELVYRGYHALDSHILGFTMWHLGHSAGGEDLTGGLDPDEFVARLVPQLQAAGYPHLAEHAKHHVSAPWRENLREFEFGLDLILDGLKKAL